MNELEILRDVAEISAAAARRIADIAIESVNERGRFSVALSGGSTPQKLYRLLGQAPFVNTIPWEQAHLYWGDERLVPPNDPESNFGQVNQSLLNQVPIPAVNVHRIPGDLSPEAAAAHYRDELRRTAAPGREWPRLDLALMGMGRDGHTASLFPGPISTRELHEPVIPVTADYDGRPANRITLTPLVFNDAHHVLFLVAGTEKAAALSAVLDGPYQPERWPAQRIRPEQGTVTWLVDEAAAVGLKHSTASNLDQ